MSGLRDALQGIYDRRGELTPRLVVDESRDENHPLHSRFEWDDEIAGEKWREQQAQELIRKVRIVYREATETEPEQSVRYWHAVRDEDGYAYKPATEIREDPFLSKLVLADMEREWKQLHRRYAHMAEFVQMVREDVAA